MIDNGIGAGLLFMLIIGGCVVHGLITKKMYWDKQEKQFKMNSPADRTARRKNHTTLIIADKRAERKVDVK